MNPNDRQIVDRTNEYRDNFAKLRRDPALIEWLPIVEQLEEIFMEMYALALALAQSEQTQAKDQMWECLRTIFQGMDYKLRQRLTVEAHKFLALSLDIYRGPLCSQFLFMLPVVQPFASDRQINLLCSECPAAATFFATQPDQQKSNE